MASVRTATESRTKRAHDHTNPNPEKTTAEKSHNDRSEEQSSGRVRWEEMNLEGLTAKQTRDLRETLEVLKAKWKEGEGESHKDERPPSQKRNPSRSEKEQSVFSRLGSSEATSHVRHGGDHHRDETWRDLRKKREEERDRTERKRKREEARRESKAENRGSGKTPETNAHQDLLNTIDALKKRVEGEINPLEGESPFTQRLEDEKKQRHLKHPNLDAYDGEGDPEDHLNQFDQLGKFYDYKDLTSCRFFATSLKGNAQRWFNRIPPRTIDTWKEFKKLFLAKFRANKPHEIHTVYLESIRQGDLEDLGSYLKRFKEAVDKIEVVNETEALIHLRRGLNPYECEKYICELMNQKPDTLSKAYALASRFITEAETMKVLKQTRTPQSQPRHNYQREQVSYQRTRDSHSKYQETSAAQTAGEALVKSMTIPVIDKTHLALPPPPPPDRREKRPEPEFTVFSMPREDILREIRHKPFFVPPPPMWTSATDRDNSKHCEYHDTHGHTTESCKSLKHFLERLLRQGHVNQYLPRQIVNTGYQQGNPGPSGTNASDKGKNVINVVIGGSSSPVLTHGNNIHAIERDTAVDHTVIFSDADLKGTQPGHTEALVVSVEILDNVIKKVLVDTGSSVDILFTHCWERMKLQGYELKPCPPSQKLYGFDHNAVPIEGVVRVPVQFGTFPNSTTKEVKLYVVNLPSAYNIILGRPALATLRAVLSITHLRMKFPTRTGTGELRGDTAASRACYGSALMMAQTEPSNWKREKAEEKKKERKQEREERNPGKCKKRKEVQTIEQGDSPSTGEQELAHEDEESQKINPCLKTCLARDTRHNPRCRCRNN